MHDSNGHPGERKTISLLGTQFWWRGLTTDAIRWVRACAPCDRARAGRLFHNTQKELHPLPIHGPFYRWGVDLAGPFLASELGHKYVMVCVDHFTKYVVFVPLSAKTSAETARAFLTHVIAPFGAPADVVTDQGGEFKGAFEELLRRCMIDHRETSASHPQADGLAERNVQTCKRALEKHVMEQGEVSRWDEALPWIQLGHNCSKHGSTGFRPYTLVYGVEPVVPPAVKVRFDAPVDFDDPEAASSSLLQRSVAMRKHVVVACGNLEAAQKRDTLRYAKVRSGGYLPMIQSFEVDDFVYLKREDKRGLDMVAQPTILQVQEVRDLGVLTLRGRCGETVSVNVSSVAPCHLPHINPAIDPTLARPSLKKMCQECQLSDKEVMLLCDGCGRGWHLSCVRPELRAIPVGAWICTPCLGQGVTEASVRERQAAAARPEDAERRPAGWQEGGGAPTQPDAFTGLRRPSRAVVPVPAAQPPADDAATSRSQRLLDEAQRLHHRRIAKAFGSEKFKGTLVFQAPGPKDYPLTRATPLFWVDYDDDDCEEMGLASAKPLLISESLAMGAQVRTVSRMRADKRAEQAPPRQSVRKGSGRARKHVGAAVHALSEVPAEGFLPRLPATWSLATGAEVTAAAFQLGVRLPAEDAARLASRLAARVPTPVLPIDRASACVAVLARNIYLPCLMSTTGLVPCGSLKTAFSQERVVLHSAAVTTYAETLQPRLLQRLQATCAPDCVVALCPVADMADLALPLANRFAAGMVAALVPYSFFSRAPASRLVRLEQWAADSLLHLCPVAGEEAGTIVSVWVIVFAHQWAVRRLLRPEVVLTPTLRFPAMN
jgi:hypothetical protein